MCFNGSHCSDGVPKPHAKRETARNGLLGKGGSNTPEQQKAGLVRELHGTLAGVHTVGDESSFGVLAALSVCGDEGREGKHTQKGQDEHTGPKAEG